MTAITHFDRAHVARVLDLLHAKEDVLDIRIPSKTGKGTVGRFFKADEREAALDFIEENDGKVNIMAVLNEIDENLPDRIYTDTMHAIARGENYNGPKQTGDENIITRRCFFVDFDPKRAAGTASTQAQIDAAEEKCDLVASALIKRGWPKPTKAFSGNGWHLLWRMNMSREGDNYKALDAEVKRAADAIARAFGDNERITELRGTDEPLLTTDGRPLIEVDPTVNNASRLCKIWGTKSCKGPAEDQHYSYLVEEGQANPLTLEQLQAVASEWGVPKKTAGRPKKSTKNVSAGAPTSTEFDLEAWLAQHEDVAILGTKTIAGNAAKMVACPWAKNHSSDTGEAQTAIWQDMAKDGVACFKCFHASCADHHWSDFRAFYDQPYTDKKEVLEGDLPVVQINNRRGDTIAVNTIAAMAQKNHPPTLFQSNSSLLALRENEFEGLTLQPLDVDELRVEAVKRVSFVAAAKSGELVPVPYPTNEALRLVQKWRDYPGIPVCDAVTKVPIYSKCGHLNVNKGHCAETRTYLETDVFQGSGRDTKTITRQDAENALQWLLKLPLSGFCFDSEASRTHALCALLQHFVRRIFDSTTPLYLLSAPVPGSGKGLLADFIGMCAGAAPVTIAYPEQDEEVAKTIGAVLMKRPAHVHWDNIKRKVEGGAFESLITSRVYNARVLGATKQMAIPTTDTTWMLSANNALFSPDMVSRSVSIRLDPKMEDPTRRTGFKIPNLLQWTQENQATCVSALLTIAGYWIAQGMPAYTGSRALSRFSSWTATMGGIMEAIGRGDSFLANADDLAASADDETEAWSAFFAEVAGSDKNIREDVAVPVGYKTHPQRVTDLLDAAFGAQNGGIYQTDRRAGGALDSMLPCATDASRRRKLADALRSVSGRVFAGWTVEYKTDARAVGQLTLEKMRSDASTNAEEDCEDVLESGSPPAAQTFAEERSKAADISAEDLDWFS